MEGNRQMGVRTQSTVGPAQADAGHRQGGQIALVHEWLTARAGSEATFAELASVWPEADLFALVHNRAASFSFEGRMVVTPRFGRAFQSHRARAVLLPLMAAAFESLSPGQYDMVVTSSHAFSRAFPTGSALHLSYTYTPVRYVWYPAIDRRGDVLPMRLARSHLQRMDLRYAATVDSFAAISSEVARRIEEVYGRESRLIFPPCDVEFFGLRAEDGLPSGVCLGEYILTVGRQIGYKRHDVAIRLAHELGLQAVVAGSGPLRRQLERYARQVGANVVFVDGPSREMLRGLYRHALFTCFPPFEDFGIVPVESLAAGTPVLAVGHGGAVDTVRDDVGFRTASAEFADLLEGARTLLNALPPAARCAEWASRFSRRAFATSVRQWVADVKGS